MSLRKLLIAAASVFIISAAAPRPAAADWLFTPFIGSTFGGSANVNGTLPSSKNDFERKLNWGASLSGGGPVGFELDFSYSPNFFGVSDSSSGINFLGDGNVTTLTGNVRVGASGGPVRPYVVGGVGLIRSKVDDPGQFFSSPSTSDFGMDVGGGVIGMFSHNVGIRGDLRYFRSFQKNDAAALDLSLGSFRFWRGTVGVTFQF
jgi:opacity protein-like surface antigen